MDREVEMQNGPSKKLGASLLRFEDAFGDIGLRACRMRPIAWAPRSTFNQILVVLSPVEYGCTAGRISARCRCRSKTIQAREEREKQGRIYNFSMLIARYAGFLADLFSLLHRRVIANPQSEICWIPPLTSDICPLSSY